MRCEFYPDEDAIIITLRPGTSAITVELDENRAYGDNEGGERVWVSLLNVSEGVDLEDLFQTQEELAEASRFLEGQGIPLLV